MSRPWLRALCLLAAMGGPALAADAPADRPPMPDFHLRTLDGHKVKLSDYAGKVVLVSFWASWCNPCKQELAFLDPLAQKYAEKGLVILAINTDGPKSQAEVRRFVSSKDLKLPVLVDADGEVGGKLDPRGVMPFTIYVDRAGHRAFEHEGFTPDEPAQIESRLQGLLEEPAPK
jgi:peroxiredoxin